MLVIRLELDSVYHLRAPGSLGLLKAIENDLIVEIADWSDHSLGSKVSAQWHFVKPSLANVSPDV